MLIKLINLSRPLRYHVVSLDNFFLCSFSFCYVCAIYLVSFTEATVFRTSVIRYEPLRSATIRYVKITLIVPIQDRIDECEKENFKKDRSSKVVSSF